MRIHLALPLVVRRRRHTRLHRSILAFSIALVALALVPPVRAQLADLPQRWSVGLTGAVNHNTHSGPAATGFSSDCWEAAPGGRGLGYSAGIVVESRFTEQFSVLSRLVYESRPANVINRSTDAFTWRPTYSPDGDTIAVVIIEDTVMFRNELVAELVTADLAVDALVFESWEGLSLHVLGGFTVSDIRSGRVTRARELPAWVERGNLAINENDEVEQGGRRVVYLRDHEIENLRRLRVSLKGGGAVVGELSSRLYFRSGVYFDLGVTDLSSMPRWSLSSTYVQLDLMVRL